MHILCDGKRADQTILDAYKHNNTLTMGATDYCSAFPVAPQLI